MAHLQGFLWRLKISWDLRFKMNGQQLTGCIDSGVLDMERDIMRSTDIDKSNETKQKIQFGSTGAKRDINRMKSKNFKW